MGVNLQRCGWAYLLHCLKDPARRRGRHLLDVGLLVLHLALFIGLPLLFAPLSHVLAFYFIRLAMVSIGMFILLVPAHFPVETPVMERAEASELGHCALQTFTTINYNGGRFVHLMATGLDYQIEHHLFPEISHVYYARMSPLVARFCRENGLPYRTWSLSKALLESWKVFIHAKPMGVNPALF
jgi:linoleoyl-CoA desaturase